MRPSLSLFCLAAVLVPKALGQSRQVPVGTGIQHPDFHEPLSGDFLAKTHGSHAPYNVTELHLSQITADQSFTTLKHPKFPFHRVRVKKTQFCDPTVKYVLSSYFIAIQQH
jgi:hypothetical protein